MSEVIPFPHNSFEVYKSWHRVSKRTTTAFFLTFFHVYAQSITLLPWFIIFNVIVIIIIIITAAAALTHLTRVNNLHYLIVLVVAKQSIPLASMHLLVLFVQESCFCFPLNTDCCIRTFS